ncbi:response regulator [Blautia schinkii]|nr:response regulator [Blautia schinkii]
MATLYIADDEPIIIKGLRKMISSFSMDLEIIGSSTDGAQAMQEILTLKPDILITDVQMPGKTGLELITEISSSALLTRIIFLSGYREFSYIKHALTHDAVDYLLKPVNEVDLQRTLIKALQFFDKQNKVAYFEKLNEKISTQLLTQDIKQHTIIHEENLRSALNERRLDTSDMSFVCVSFLIPLHLQKELRKVPFEHFELLRFSSFNFLKERCDSFSRSLLLGRKNNSLDYLFLINPPESLDSVEKYLIESRGELKKKYQTEVLAGIGEVVSSLEEINFSFSTAYHAVSQYFFTEETINVSCRLKQDFRYSFDDYSRI